MPTVDVRRNHVNLFVTMTITKILERFGNFPSLDPFKTVSVATVTCQSDGAHHTLPEPSMSTTLTTMNENGNVMSDFVRNRIVQHVIVIVFEKVRIDNDDG